LIFHSSRDSYLAHHPSANFPSANSPSREKERGGESGERGEVRAFLVDVFLSTPGRRDGGRAVAVYLSVIRERELDRVLESFASLIESRQRERRWHQKMDKFLDPEFVLREIRVFSSVSFSFPRDGSFLRGTKCCLSQRDWRNFCITNGRNVRGLRRNREERVTIAAMETYFMRKLAKADNG